MQHFIRLRDERLLHDDNLINNNNKNNIGYFYIQTLLRYLF